MTCRHLIKKNAQKENARVLENRGKQLFSIASNSASNRGTAKKKIHGKMEKLMGKNCVVGNLMKDIGRLKDI